MGCGGDRRVEHLLYDGVALRVGERAQRGDGGGARHLGDCDLHMGSPRARAEALPDALDLVFV